MLGVAIAAAAPIGPSGGGREGKQRQQFERRLHEETIREERAEAVAAKFAIEERVAGLGVMQNVRISERLSTVEMVRALYIVLP